MLDKIISGIPNIRVKNIEEIDQSVVSSIKNNYVRSPEKDCFMTTPDGLSNVAEHKMTMAVTEAITDEDLREIQKIDLEAFAQTDPISSSFKRYKADILDRGLESHVIKNENGKVVGYFQLEPIENGELYVYSIGIQKDLRKTKSSYEALKLIQENIQKVAFGKNIKKVTLHVDASNAPLVKMYKKYGFEIKDTLNNYYANGDPAYYMEGDVKKAMASIKSKNKEN